MTRPDLKEHRVSVGDLVHFAARRGDLYEPGFGAAGRAAEGVEGHQILQKKRPKGYQAEVALKHEVTHGNTRLQVSGRMDGIYADLEPPILEEIKTTRLDVTEVPEHQVHNHRAQALIYAYIYCLQQDLPAIRVRVTYFNVLANETHEVDADYGFQELSSFFSDVATRYVSWLELIGARVLTRDQSIRHLNFPFEVFREGQRNFSTAVYKAVKGERKLFVEAPTGIGKTMGTLFPAIKTMTADGPRKLFFLTAKRTGLQAAERALNLLRNHGLRFQSLTIAAKERLCRDEDNQPCNPEHCLKAKGYFDRLRAGLEETVQQDDLNPDHLQRIAERHQLCPFAFSLDCAPWADAVLCDYNYAFHPNVALRRFFNEDPNPYVLLIDEAHNLVDRGRDMFSAELNQYDLKTLRKKIRGPEPSLARRLDGINRAFNKHVKNLTNPEQVDKEAPRDLEGTLRKYTLAFETRAAEKDKPVPDPSLLDFYFQCKSFLRILEIYDHSFYTLCSRRGRSHHIKCFNVDPAHLLRKTTDLCRAVVFFSATLTPFHYFSRLLGGDEKTWWLQLDYPFPKENLQVVIYQGIDTRHHQRSAGLDHLCDLISLVIDQYPGNHLVFFPSYQYLNLCRERFEERRPDREVLAQDPAMDDIARAAFLDTFRDKGTGSVLGFAVMGGVFGEGIDLEGEALVGALIVGLGLAPPDPERVCIRNHFTHLGEPGHDYAFRIPAMNRVRQNAGRVIRGEDDRGLVCLIDPRFNQPANRELFPNWWSPTPIHELNSLKKLLTQINRKAENRAEEDISVSKVSTDEEQ